MHGKLPSYPSEAPLLWEHDFYGAEWIKRRLTDENFTH